MENLNDSESEVLTIHFNVDNHNVNAEAVASMIKATAGLIRAASKEIDASCSLDVRVAAIKEGSLDIPLDIVIPVGVALFPILSNTPIIASSISIFKDFLLLLRKLKGNPLPKPQDDGTFRIGDQNITINATTVNFFNNCPVGKDITDAFQETQKDDKIKGVSFVRGTEKDEIISIPKAEFGSFGKIPTSERDEKEPYEDVLRTLVTVHTAVLAGKGKWKIIFQENIISVAIKDANFLKKVASARQRFGAGDQLDVMLSRKHFVEEQSQEMIIDTTGYSITQVLNYLQKTPSGKVTSSQQTNLFDV